MMNNATMPNTQDDHAGCDTRPQEALLSRLQEIISQVRLEESEEIQMKSWGIWAVADGGTTLYLGELFAKTRGQAKRKAHDLDVWKNHPQFNGINPLEWKLIVGAPKKE